MTAESCHSAPGRETISTNFHVSSADDLFIGNIGFVTLIVPYCIRQDIRPTEHVVFFIKNAKYAFQCTTIIAANGVHHMMSIIELQLPCDVSVRRR